MKRILTALLGVTIALAVATSANAGAPPAPTTDGPPTVTVTATPQATGRASVESVITCTLQINNPHKSTHVPGTINVTATWGCSSIVAELDIEIYLYLGGILVGDGSSSGEATANLQANAYSGCTSGTYQGIADGRVVFPAGYTPPTQFTTVHSGSVFISCP